MTGQTIIFMDAQNLLWCSFSTISDHNNPLDCDHSTSHSLWTCALYTALQHGRSKSANQKPKVFQGQHNLSLLSGLFWSGIICSLFLINIPLLKIHEFAQQRAEACVGPPLLFHFLFQSMHFLGEHLWYWCENAKTTWLRCVYLVTTYQQTTPPTASGNYGIYPTGPSLGFF